MIECILQIAGVTKDDSKLSWFEKKVFLPVIPPVGGEMHDWEIKQINYQFDGTIILSLVFISARYNYSCVRNFGEIELKLLSDAGFEAKSGTSIKRTSVYKSE